MVNRQSDHLLDNPTWHALNSRHAHLAVGTALAKRYPSDVAIFLGLADHSESAFHDLWETVKAGEVTALFEAEPPESIAGWTTHQTLYVEQMVSQQPVPAPASTVEIVELAASDVPDMLLLVELTHPGPFLPRTIEMGRYIGIRQSRQLVAMAGERCRMAGYVEISAVCTHPNWQGKGYARQLCSVLINDIWGRGDVPYLHVFPGNVPARRLYETMHFTKRCDLNGIIISHP